MSRCDHLDLIEAAIVRAQPVELVLVDGTVRVARPVAIAAVDGDDRVSFADGPPVAMNDVALVRPRPRG